MEKQKELKLITVSYKPAKVDKEAKELSLHYVFFLFL